MLKRFMIIQGIQGTLVTDPHATQPHRFVGMEPAPPDKWEGTKHARKYAPVVQARVYHPDLVAAVRAGELKQFGEFVMAEDELEAVAKCKDPAVKKFFDDRAATEKKATEDAEKAAKDRADKAAKEAKVAKPAAQE